jgi:predicted HicB family RNase H-like nuclease
MEVEMKTEKIFTFRIPTTLLEAGHVLAESQGLTLAQLMRRLLHEAVLKAGQQP